MQRHILTIAVEDYFHVAALRGAISRKHWDRLEPRLERNVDELLDLLAQYGATGTFFVFGQIAELVPSLIQRIVDAGHEVANRGFRPHAGGFRSREEFLRDLSLSEQALEVAGANHLLGYRAPRWMRAGDLWILDDLAEQGYVYDSSINPILRRFSDRPELLRTHEHTHPSGELSIWEFPVSTMNLGGVRIAISGGNYIRQLPHTLLSRVVARRSKRDDQPLVFYLMPWEIDRAQPRIKGVPWIQRMRHYRNLGKTRWVLELYLQQYEFCSIAQHLGIELERPSRPATNSVGRKEFGDGPSTGEPLTVVVPLFNEAVNITYLRRALLELRHQLDGQYRSCFLLVDDCSTDGTYDLMKKEFADVADCRVLRHGTNSGVAAAIMTGVGMSTTEIVCSIDCDGSYDPLIIEQMLPLLDGADMVTASPYHPGGAVLNVPPWRLFMSKSLSRMYSFFLGSQIHTYTSCCRVYRRQAMEKIHLHHGGFLGVAEMLIELKDDGGRVVEYPATLESRLLGESKMKIGRTILAHLGLLWGLALKGRNPRDSEQQDRNQDSAV